MEKRDKNLMRIWDFLVSSEPNMILFLISSVILIEVEEVTDPIEMETLQQIKKFKFTDVKINTY